VSTTGLLFFSAVFAFIGLIWLGNAEGYIAFAAAGVFAVGICFFWPTMIGFVSENLPKTGPLGMSLMGGVGLLSTSLILPIFGLVYENQLVVLVNKIPPSEIKLAAGANTLLYVSLLPLILIVSFGILYFRRKKTIAGVMRPVTV
jgi:hypothetical protein